ncbi:hypothetical protein [Methylobacterium iners]|nr:hypothetical protein [Methylobacterium iners]
MPTLSRLLALCGALLLGGCLASTTNTLSSVETADLRFTSIEVRVPPETQIDWTEAVDAYRVRRAQAAQEASPATPAEIRAHVDAVASARLRAALERSLAERPQGSRSVRLVTTITSVSIPSPLMRVIAGGGPIVGADIDIVDARTGAVLTRYLGAKTLRAAGQGVGGTLIDAALVSGGMDDLFDRAANGFASGFTDWLRAAK